MATITRMLVCTDAENNNNKFWEVTWDDQTGAATVRYGRVGQTGVSEPFNFTKSSLEAKIRSKLKVRAGKPAYQEIDVISSKEVNVSPQTATKVAIKEAAMEQLTAGDKTLQTLIEKLVAANKHELYVASGGKINLNIDTGMVTTALGVVTKSNIEKARKLLNDISQYVTNNNLEDETFIKSLNQYLMYIPQKVDSKRGWHKNFLTSDKDLQKQSGMLDQLEASVDMADAQLKQAVADANDKKDTSAPKLFNASLKLNTDPKKMKEITELFVSTLSTMHTSRKLRPVKIYEVELNDMKAAWDKDGANMKDQRLLWHGTRVFNVLSILKNGLMIPKSGGSINITGRMFGDGVYLSDISTKALNYSQGYWDGGTKDNNCFMFLCDAAMGNYHVPRNPDSQLHTRGYDSVWAQPGKSGIQNNEMIVFRTSQVNIRYLVEFAEV